jgi:DNA-binding IclR family transcriptional regulator
VFEEFIARSATSRDETYIADPRRFREEIARTWDRGYSIDDEEDSVGVRCFDVVDRGLVVLHSAR